MVADALSKGQCMPDIEEEVEDYEGDIAELGIIDILPIMERDNLVLEQSKDMVIKNALIVSGKNHYVGRLVVKEGVLFEKREGHNDRLIVPRSLVIDVVSGAHEENGHQGIDKTMRKINETYTWLGKYRDIRMYIRKCMVCSKVKEYDVLEVGDIVRVTRRVVVKRELPNSWGDKKWIVIEKLGDNAVYRIKNNEGVKSENIINLKRVIE